MADFHPLEIVLEAAVPLAIEELKARGGPTEADFEAVRDFTSILAEKGDVLLYGHENYRPARGEPGPGELCGRLIRMLAVMAFVPGGVRLFGQKWEAKRDG